MSNSPSITTAHTLPVHWSRLASIALWGVQVVLAGMFLLAGGSKLAGAAAMVALFDAIGVGQWFRYVTGGIEVASAVALLVPSLAPFGAIALVATMVGAVATHLFIVGGSPAVPLVLLLGSLAVAWARRDQLSKALSRLL
ncbi:MAG: DoxX family protein [Vicinamibacterales bacterium]